MAKSASQSRAVIYKEKDDAYANYRLSCPH
jgi:hypothetical protein